MNQISKNLKAENGQGLSSWLWFNNLWEHGTEWGSVRVELELDHTPPIILLKLQELAGEKELSCLCYMLPFTLCPENMIQATSPRHFPVEWQSWKRADKAKGTIEWNWFRGLLVKWILTHNLHLLLGSL